MPSVYQHSSTVHPRASGSSWQNGRERNEDCNVVDRPNRQSDPYRNAGQILVHGLPSDLSPVNSVCAKSSIARKAGIPVYSPPCFVQSLSALILWLMLLVQP